MRNRLMIGTAALLLASATLAGAQDKPQQTTTPSNGTIDIGGRFTDVDGDEARYERYRDLQNGVDANFLFGKETTSWTFDFLAKNIGYDDGRYVLNFKSSKWKITALFDQTPTNYAYYTRTPYNCTAGDCSLDANLRSQVQARTATGIWTTPAQLLAGGTAYASIANQFDLQSRRDTLAAEVRFSATDNLDLIVGVNTYKRVGQHAVGRVVRVPRRHRAPARDRQPGDRLARRRRVGEPPGDVPLRVPAPEVRPEHPVAALGQPAAGDRLLPDRHRRPAPGHVLGPERLHQRQRAGLRPHGPAAVEQRGPLQLDGHDQAARPHHGQREPQHGDQPPGQRAHPLDDQLPDQQRGDVGGVPGAARAAARHVQHARELRDRHGERELAGDQAPHPDRPLPVQQPHRLHAASSTPSSTCASTRCPRRRAASPTRSTSAATRSTPTPRSPGSSAPPSASATGSTAGSTPTARPRAGRTTPPASRSTSWATSG